MTDLGLRFKVCDKWMSIVNLMIFMKPKMRRKIRFCIKPYFRNTII